MAPVGADARSFAYPKILRYLKTNKAQNGGQQDVCWNAKFYPYDSNDDKPVFCLSNKVDMMVCQINPATDPPSVDIIRQFEVKSPADEGAEVEKADDQYCSCAWAYINPDEPLLLGAGDPGLIRVFDIIKGELKTTLVGHGLGVINDLATHPKYPWIVASASHDKSIRIWDLRRWDSKHDSATIIICGAGHGHKESVLSVGWHDGGRYLISGGFDNRVCVWTIPDLSPESSFWEEISPAQAERHSDRVRMIYFPHFVTLAVHANWIDCVRFWGDNILSKAADEHKVVLWRMTGFNSSLEPPDTILAPKAEEHLVTRNGFTREITSDDNGVTKIVTKEAYRNSLAHQRLLEFHIPHTSQFFIRFDLLKRSPTHPDIHDVLAIGNTKSTIQFWDLEAVERGYDYNAGRSGRGGRRTRGGPGGRKGAIAHVASKGSLRRLNQLSLERSESASASLPSIDTNTNTGTATGTNTPTSTSPSRSSPPLRSNSTDATSLMSDSLHLNNGGLSLGGPLPFGAPTSAIPTGIASQPEPPENRERFPLSRWNVPLKKAHHAVTFKDCFDRDFTARGVAWSRDGRYCVIAGETIELVALSGGSGGPGKAARTPVLIGAAVVFGRDLP